VASATVPGSGFGYVSSKKRTGPDPAIVKDQLLWLQNVYKTFGETAFCKYFFWILRKNATEDEKMALPEGFWNRRLVPFSHNRVQIDITKRRKKNNLCVKYRQGGYTTYFINDRLYLPAILEPGAGCLLISQNHFYAAQHFSILKRTHRYFGTSNPYDYDACQITRWFHEHALHTTFSNRRELIFDQLDSKILVDSAEQEEVGQGLTLNHVVCTELARWPGNPEETLANMKEAIAEGGTLDYESTCNGLGGYFYDEAMRCRDPKNTNAEFNYFFHEWWWHDEYRAKQVRGKTYESDDRYVDMSEIEEEERELQKRIGLEIAQLAWRRIKKKNLRHNFDEKYPEDDITCFLVSGKSFFDRDILRMRLMELRQYVPQAVKRDGDLQIFSRRIKGRTYCIGADTATGRQVSTEDTDFSAAVVLDVETGEEMAAYCSRVPPEDFADDLLELGRQYNNAVIGVERGTGGDGGVTLFRIEEEQYYNIYKHVDKFKAKAQDSKKKTPILVPGWPNNNKTRPIACNRVRAFIEDHPDRIFDMKFIEEAMRFVRNLKGKPVGGGEEDNAHDDRVMARACAFYVRLDLLNGIDPEMKRERYGQNEPEYDEPAGEAQ
jgi:hypothetical protein